MQRYYYHSQIFTANKPSIVIKLSLVCFITRTTLNPLITDTKLDNVVYQQITRPSECG